MSLVLRLGLWMYIAHLYHSNSQDVPESFRPSFHPSVRPSVRPSVCPSFRPSVRPSVCPSVCPSVRPSVRQSVRPSSWKNCAPIGRILIKFYLYFSKNLPRKIQASLKSDKNNGTLHEDISTVMPISRLIIVTMVNVSDKSSRENQNRHFYPFFSENRAVYDTIWKK